MPLNLRSAGLLTVATLVITSLLGACAPGPSDVAKISRGLIEQVNTSTPPVQPAQDISSEEQRVYVDASLSMNGYVGDGKERTTFDEFIDAMPDVLPGCKVFRYGHQGDKAPERLSDVIAEVEFDAQLHKRSFYQLKFNPDDVLFTDIAREPKPVLSVLLTDGVESDAQGQINTAVVEAIKTWMSQGKVFAILGLNSRFSGRLYSERQRRMLEPITVEARPFYAFVFSPGRREFDDLRGKLTRRFADVRTILFSDDAISCRPELPAGHEASYASESPPDKPYFWQMITLRNLKEGAEEPLLFRFHYDVKETYPVRSLGLRVTPSLYRWDGEQFQQAGAPPNTRFEVVEPPDGRAGMGNMTLTYSLKPAFSGEGQTDYSFYVIDQAAYIKEVSEELAAASTRDDSTPANAGKTYRFQELITTLMDVHFKERLAPRASPRLYLTAAHN